MRYELTDDEWITIKPMLPNKPGGVPGERPARPQWHLLGVAIRSAVARPAGQLRSVHHLLHRFVRWRRAGVWGRIMDALATAHDASVQMIDTSIVRVHQHGGCILRNRNQSMGRSRGGLTSKIHAVVDTHGLPVRLALKHTTTGSLTNCCCA